MISENHYIAKGIYRHPQLGHFISVKNYIFLRDNGKKYLLLRFSNELDYVVDGLTCEVFQYDLDGNEITSAKINMSGMNICPHEMFTNDAALEVDEKCMDFRVVFLEVRSGKYRYRTIDKTVCVHYAEDEDLFDGVEELYETEPIREYSVIRQRFGKVRNVKSVATIIVLLLLGLNILNMCFSYRAYMNEREKNVSSGEIYGIVNVDDGERYAEI